MGDVDAILTSLSSSSSPFVISFNRSQLPCFELWFYLYGLMVTSIRSLFASSIFSFLFSNIFLKLLFFAFFLSAFSLVDESAERSSLMMMMMMVFIGWRPSSSPRRRGPNRFSIIFVVPRKTLLLSWFSTMMCGHFDICSIAKFTFFSEY